jgi:hypothetical protein
MHSPSLALGDAVIDPGELLDGPHRLLRRVAEIGSEQVVRRLSRVTPRGSGVDGAALHNARTGQ